MSPPSFWALQFHFPSWGKGYLFTLLTQPALASACCPPTNHVPRPQGALACLKSPKCLSDWSQQPKRVKYKCSNWSNFPGSQAAKTPIHMPAWPAEGLGSKKRILG